uniref:V-type proton ATPase subunit E n=1 Tax=Metchnikovella dogieli TaxID=2804710 RepID=A0A896WLD0_9MICR|nr:V-type proton ATPase subunit E [Metchnikovella dogieli]
MNVSEATREREMEKMIAFIRQEALEKVSELEIKAEEEQNIERARIVQQETISLEEKAEKRKKEFLRTIKIGSSGKASKTNMRVLELKREIINGAFSEACDRVLAQIGEEASYREILRGYIREGMHLLGDENVFIKCMERDFALVQDICRQEFEGAVILDGTLEKVVLGGVVLMNKTKRVWVVNTLQERIKIAKEELVPSLARILF